MLGKAKKALVKELGNSEGHLGVEYKREDKTRGLTVNSELAFSQGKKNSEGSFLHKFSHLT